jgi:probable DNA metabolism protein
MHDVTLTKLGELGEFRDAARRLIAADVPPADILWHEAGEAGLFAAATPLQAAPAAFSVPAGYIRLAEDAICHNDPERFALLYELLWRLTHGERALLAIPADPLVHRLERMRKAIGREVHKMHAFVRFRRVAAEDGERFIAWFEPEHYVLDRAMPFFVDRFSAMRWSILTPIGSRHWDGATVTPGPALRRADAPNEDALEDWWRTYYRATFNPARANPEMMRAEMPKRYWRNLPEAELIPALLAQSAGRTDAMLEARPTEPRKRIRPVAPPPEAPEPAPLAEIARQASSCQRCPLFASATQTIFGAGPSEARIMLVGEQPGDQEDLAGAPFVGPAGQLLDRALAEAGIDRGTVYVTNAVKHFKFEPRGKRRIHKKPDRPEIEACKWWLERELAVVRPALVVAMGATAGQALTGRAVRVMSERGAIADDPRGFRILQTVHPSFLLRLPDPEAKQREFAAFVADLRLGWSGGGATSLTTHAKEKQSG